MYKLDLEMAEEPEKNCQHTLDHRKSKGIPRKSIVASLTMLKPLTVWITTNCGIFLYRESHGSFRKTSLSVSLIALKPLTMWMMTRKALREMRIPDHLTYLLRNLYSGQEATVRTLYGTSGWFKIEEGVQQGCLLSPLLFHLYAEHIMRNARLGELQAGIKIGRRNIISLRYVDDTTLMAESEEELKDLLMRVKGRVEEPT